MDLDLIIPTFNRRTSLERTLRSILHMPVPPMHRLSVTVADNNSTDDTRRAVDRIAPLFAGRLQYVAAARGQGRSFALNAGIAATGSEIVAFVDDDEEVDLRWSEIAFQAFADPSVDYISGRYQPVWQIPPPPWVNHPNTRGGIGWMDFGPVARSFEDRDFDGLAIGGNTVIRRRCLEEVGPYSEGLGRSANHLFAGEDTEMHMRLKAAGFHGLYLPDLVVLHHIPAARLTKRYMRRWAFWASVSASRIMSQRPQSGPHWLGLPRWMYGRVMRCPFQFLKSLVAGDPAAIFNHELTVWRFAGVFYGMHVFESRRRDCRS